MYHEANDSGTKDLKVVTPLRYSHRIREKMCKVLDTVQDEDAYVSIWTAGRTGTKSTVFIHKQTNALKETSAEVEE